MQAIRSILVVIRPSEPESLALKRAKMIASVTQSHLHLLICDTRQDYSEHLKTISQPLIQEGYQVSTQQAWHNSVHQTIIHVQQAEGCGLVVKRYKGNRSLKKALLIPDDWKLLRFCPTPVLLVKTETDKDWGKGNVLASIDIGNVDSEHQVLNDCIVEYAHHIAQLASARLHVVCAHPSPMLSAADPTFQVKESIEKRYREQCKTFQDEYEIRDDCVHILEGPADVLIPQTAKQLEAVVTVIGTVARTGLSGALIGNTAEVILDTLETDVLVLKPSDILEPLEDLVRY